MYRGHIESRAHQFMNDQDIRDASKKVAHRIYINWKWKVTTQAHTLEEVEKSLDDAIQECKQRIPDVEVLANAIDGFNKMRARLSEFSVTPEPEPDCVCMTCGRPLPDGVEKRWIADGQYECVVCSDNKPNTPPANG